MTSPVVERHPPPDTGVRAELFIVPGTDLTPRFYRAWGQALAQQGVAVSIIALPGFGDQPALPSPSWTAYADVVHQAVRASEAAGGVLAGHSSGGLMALLALAEDPDLAKGLILMEPFMIPWRWLAEKAGRSYLERLPSQEGSFDNWTGAYRRVASRNLYPAWAIEAFVEVRRTHDEASVTALFGGLARIYPLPFEKIECPTLVVRGGASGWRQALAFSVLRRFFQRAESAVVPGAGHWLLHEADDQLCACVLPFILRTMSA